MTVNTSNKRIEYSGNGSTTVFAYNFRILDETHLEVILVNSSGVETVQTLTTHYTVAGAGDAGGGDITMATAPASGESLVLRRKMPFTQDIDYVSGDPFPAETHERGIDERVMEAQELVEITDRALKAPKQDSAIGDMPAAAARIGKLLTFGTTGDPEATAYTSAQVQAAVNVAANAGTNDTEFIFHTQGATTYGLATYLGARHVFNVKDYGAVADGTTDDATAINSCITALEAAYAAGTRFPILDFGDGEYAVNSTIEIDGVTDLQVVGNFSLLLKSTQDIGFTVKNCPRFNQVGRMQILGNTASTAYADRNNFVGFNLDNCTGSSLGTIDVRDFKADGVRFTGTTSQPSAVKLDISRCGTGNSASTRLADVSWTHVSETGAANTAAQRSVIDLASLPSDVTSYMDATYSEDLGDNYNPVYLEIDGDLFYVVSYSGTQVTIWPWVDPAKAGVNNARFIFGCGVYSDGGDTSVADLGSLDISVCGIGYLGMSLYPANISSFVGQVNSIGILVGESTSGAAEELSIARGYFETNVFDIVQASQAPTGIQILSTTALSWDKCYRLYSKTGSYIRVRTSLEEIFIVKDGHEYKNLRDENRVQSAVTVELTKPDPFYLTTSGQTVLIACDEDVQALTNKKTQLVYVYAEANGMSIGGTVTFTPPSGCTLNGGATDASQTYNTSSGPQVFLIARANATTYYVDPLGQSTITKV